MRAKVKDLQEGEQAVVKGVIQKTIKHKKGDGEPWIDFRITDSSGMAFAKIWTNLEIYPIISELESGDFVEANVVCTQDGDYTHIDIISIKKIEEGVIVNIDSLKDELRQVVAGIKDDQLKKLVCAVLARPDMNEAYFVAPATMMSGYSFRGGGLASVVRLIRLIKNGAQVFNEWNHNTDDFVGLNVDLLCTVAILEHTGNVRAYQFNRNRVEKTIEGELLNEAELTLEILNEELPKVSIPKEKQLLLKHLLGSAHGRSDWGQLFTHRSREAYVFYFLWNLNLQMGHFEYLDRLHDTEEFVKLFQKNVFLGVYDNV
ncbi:metal-dependent phosphohydrolase (plasmid) [Paenibacillus thiaminolyticus]|uniref:metal-dependent phosphohydrolase n=1 Tax=Paenibacillus thiaminolyticus TaxID=49283 RepID=UPI00233127FC|nr:metal-dependent phosphohydrolase [Paenibacillus thiaminolyticus]WCF11418.1 metal-dependent phosphohydrolase [Paenibacillus thiaminolyticus]